MPFTSIEDRAEETVTCPYNKAHVMLRKRMAFHLVNCRKGFPDSEKVVCAFNNCHVINKEEKEFHESTCEARGVIDNFVYRYDAAAVRPAAALPVENMPADDCEESWDEPCASVLDEIKENAENKPVMRMKLGATKSQRKEFKQQERRRLDALTAQAKVQPDAATAKSSSHYQNPQSQVNDKTVKFNEQVTSIERPASSSSNVTRAQTVEAPKSNLRQHNPPEPTDLDDIRQKMANLSSQAPVRDKSNPWGAPVNTRQEASYATEFPVLPAARRGRGSGRGVSRLEE